MSIRIDQWHASIGLFYGQIYGHFSTTLSRGCDFNVAGFMLCFFAVFTFLLLLKHGDSILAQIAYYSLNSILAHNKTVLNRSIQY